MKKVHVDQDWPYLKKVLDRDHLSYQYDQGVLTCDLSDERFDEAMEDAACEKQRERPGHLPVYSLRTLKNKEKLKRLQKLNGNHSYTILKKDIAAFYDAFI